MSHAGNHHKISYIEFAASDMARAKQFYATVFGWSFKDWGPDYIGFDAASAGIDGGFRKGKPERIEPADAAPLIVLYSTDLKATEAAIVAAGGTIVVPTFEFPGGRRFHFTDGVGNCLECGRSKTVNSSSGFPGLRSEAWEIRVPGTDCGPQKLSSPAAAAAACAAQTRRAPASGPGCSAQSGRRGARTAALPARTRTD